MQFVTLSRTVILFTAVLAAAALPSASGQEAETKATPVREGKGMPPRATPGDYQAHAQAGPVTIAAEFMEHSVPTRDGVYESSDYVVVEAGLFGPPQGRANISYDNFSLRINGKKPPLPAQSSEVVMRSLKDPQWAPPQTESNSKTSIGGGGAGADSTPAPVHMPFDLQRAMEVKVQKAAMPEGDRALPEAGLLFFQYHGKAKGIRSVELVYTGPSGNAVLTLQP